MNDDGQYVSWLSEHYFRPMREMLAGRQGTYVPDMTGREHAIDSLRALQKDGPDKYRHCYPGAARTILICCDDSHVMNAEMTLRDDAKRCAKTTAAVVDALTAIPTGVTLEKGESIGVLSRRNKSIIDDRYQMHLHFPLMRHGLVTGSGHSEPMRLTPRGKRVQRDLKRRREAGLP